MLLYGFIFIFIILLLLLVVLYREYSKTIDRLTLELTKFKYFNVLNSQWLRNKNHGLKLEDYLLRNNFHEVAIYGLGELGRLVCEELMTSRVKVKYVIDRNEKKQYEGIDVVRLSDQMDPVDGIIVTVGEGYSTIESSIRSMGNYAVISLEEILLGNQ